MEVDNLKSQQLQLLARKALLNDELTQINTGLAQIGAILQFHDQQQKAQAEAPKSEPAAA